MRSYLQLSVTLLVLSVGTSTTIVLAHGGHGNEFGGSQTVQATGSVQVDEATAKRLGLKLETVSRRPLAFGIKTTGQIETLPNQKVEVTTPVTGTVTQLLVKPSDVVEAGQPVAVMTTPELAELRTTALDRRSEAIGSIQQAEADLRLAQQNLTQQNKILGTGIQQARSQLSFAQERSDKDRSLLASGAIPRRTFLESETKLTEAQAALTKAESALEVSAAQAQLQRAESAVSVAQSRVSLSGETYQARLRQLGASPNEDGTITIAAPIAGTVADRETTQGESGQDAGKKVMTIVNSSSVQVSGNLYEKDLSRVKVGQKVRVKVGDRAFEGRISVIGSAVQGETRTVPLKAELGNADSALKPGMFVELEVLTNQSAAVVAIPKAAIVETNDKKKIVFVQNGTAFQPAEVELGQESGDAVEVKSGLFEGDKIVTQRANQLYAQSLRSTAPDDHDKSPVATAAFTNSQNAAFDWWMIPAGIAIVSGTFWAGMVWAKRQIKHQTFTVNASELSGTQGETGNYLNGSSIEPIVPHTSTKSLSKHQQD